MMNFCKPGLFLALLFVWHGAAAAAEFVVLSSTVASVSVGQIIEPGQRITLPEKARLVLVNEAGRTISLKGPYAGAPGGEAKGGKSKFVAALASLVRSTEEDAHSVGAIRAASIRNKRQAMMINISETGDFCLFEDGGEELTRYQSETWPEINITAVADGRSQTVAWPKGARTLPWPEALPIKNGATYLVDQSGKDSRTMLVMHRLSGEYPTDAHLVVEMASRGCLEQSKMMLALIRRSAR